MLSHEKISASVVVGFARYVGLPLFIRHHHIQEERDPQLHRCENLKAWKKESVFILIALMKYLKIRSTVECAHIDGLLEDFLNEYHNYLAI
jgi:hypothetical protein